MSAPRKVNPDQIEVLDANGREVPGAQVYGADGAGERRRWPQGVRVIQAGPLGLLALPFVLGFLILVPLFSILALLFSFLFGRSVFRVFRWKSGHGWGGSR